MTSYLIDSGAFLAALDTRDKYHVAASAFLRAHSADTFYLPESVFVETIVLTKARLGAEPAIELGRRLLASGQFVIMYPTAEDRQETWAVFSRYTDKDWSYVDCALLALARRLQIAEIFAFDHHFDQMGSLQRVPV